MKFRSEAAKLRVDNWLASRVESTEKPRSGDVVSRDPSGAASSSAPAAAASGVQCRWPYQAVQQMNDSEVTKFQIMVSRG